MLICGPSGLGKATFLENLIIKKNDLFNISIDRIIWCYAEESAKPNFETVENETNEPILLILDDLMMGAFNKNLCELFTKESHHRNFSVILVTQNIFHKSSHTRDITLNTKYIVAFKNPRDKLQYQCLARQIYPENPTELFNIYKEERSNVTDIYLLISLRALTIS